MVRHYQEGARGWAV